LEHVEVHLVIDVKDLVIDVQDEEV